MWSNSFNDYEPSQLSQVNSTTSYQVFGSPAQLSQVGYVLQHNFQQPSGNNVLTPQPLFQYQAWSNSTEPVNSSFEHAHMWSSPVDEQTPFSAHPKHSALNAGLNRKFEAKSVVVAKINKLRSENATLDEEIEEQKNRNSLLMKRIADTREELSTMQQNAAYLYNECQSMDETSERFLKQLDEEKWKLLETITKKRSDISEVKGDANSAEDSGKSSKEILKVNTGESSRTDEESDTSQITVIKVNIPAGDSSSVAESPTLNVSPSTHSSSPSAHEGGVETGCEYVEDSSSAHSDVPKKTTMTVGKSSRFVGWLQRLSSIPKGNKDE